MIKDKPDYSKLTDAQLRELIRTRYKNEGISEDNHITKIKITGRSKSRYGTYAIRYKLHASIWGIETGGIVFNKFYLNEFRLLQKYKIIY